MTKDTGRYEQPFRLILPDQKRLRDAFNSVMAEAGLVFQKPSPRAAQGITRDTRGILPDIETFELRADAALEWINDGAANMAVVGEDSLREYQAANSAVTGRNQPESLLSLNRVSACSLWFAAKPEIYIRELSDMGSMRIATSYPAILQQMLAKADVKPNRIIVQKGGVESTITAGRADAILEVVQTGASLAANGLEKKLLAFNSSALLVQNSANTRENGALAEALAARITETLSPRKAAQTFERTASYAP